MEEQIYKAYQAELCWLCADGAGGKGYEMCVLAPIKIISTV